MGGGGGAGEGVRGWGGAARISEIFLYKESESDFFSKESKFNNKKKNSGIIFFFQKNPSLKKKLFPF